MKYYLSVSQRLKTLYFLQSCPKMRFLDPLINLKLRTQKCLKKGGEVVDVAIGLKRTIQTDFLYSHLQHYFQADKHFSKYLANNSEEYKWFDEQEFSESTLQQKFRTLKSYYKGFVELYLNENSEEVIFYLKEGANGECTLYNAVFIPYFYEIIQAQLLLKQNLLIYGIRLYLRQLMKLIIQVKLTRKQWDKELEELPSISTAL